MGEKIDVNLDKLVEDLEEQRIKMRQEALKGKTGPGKRPTAINIAAVSAQKTEQGNPKFKRAKINTFNIGTRERFQKNYQKEMESFAIQEEEEGKSDESNEDG